MTKQSIQIRKKGEFTNVKTFKAKLIGCLLCLLITIIPLVIVISSTSGQVGIDWNRINWVLIDEDENESGGENWRDVIAAYAAYDANYLYLKLETVEPPKFPTSKNDRDDDKYRWFLDFDGNMYWQGNVLYEAEYLISVQDKNDDGIGEMYLLFDSDNDSNFDDEQWVTIVVNSTDGGFRINGYQLEIYINWSKIGGMPRVLWLSWCTDRSDQNLNQCPTTDRAETAYGVVIRLGSISGYKWEDLNRNGLWDTGNEPPIQDWEIHLQSNAMSWEAYTNESGYYQFIALPEGTYTVSETIPYGWIQTHPGNNSYIVQILSGEQIAGKDFGNFKTMTSLSIRKSANAAQAHVGDEIEYSFNITNTGNVPLLIKNVTDNVIGSIMINQTLEPNQWIIVNAKYTVKESDPDPLVNTVTVYATYDSSTLSASDTWIIDILHPSIMVEKTANVTEAYIGDTIQYKINVTNTGDCELHNVNVSDSLFGNLLTNGILEPKQSIIVTKTYITENKGQLTNTANASGTDPLGMCVYDEDSWTVDVSIPPPATATVTFNATGLSLDASNKTVLTVDGTSYTFSQLPLTFEWIVGSSHNFSWSSPVEVDSGKRYVWTSTSGLSELQNGEIKVPTGGGNITGNYKTQYHLTVKTDPEGLVIISVGGWYDKCTYVDLEVPGFVPSEEGENGVRYRFDHWSVDGTPVGGNPIKVHMDAAHIATAHYIKQYKVIFNQSGLDSSAVGTIVTVDGEAKEYGDLPFSKWVDSGNTINYNYTVTVLSNTPSKQFRLNFVEGPASPITVEGKTDIVGNYVVKWLVTFDQAGVGNDFNGTIVTIDGIDNLGATELPKNYWWDDGSDHTFAFHSPLKVDGGKRYVWTGTSGLSTQQSGLLTISISGSITGHYKTQYKLVVETDPEGLTPQPTREPAGEQDPAGGWWYDSSTSVTLTAQQVEGFKFSYWSVNGANQGDNVNPITVGMDASKTAIAHYANLPTVANVTFNVKGVQSDYAGIVLMVDEQEYVLDQLPITFTWNIGSNHSFEFKSPLIVNLNQKRYVWISTSGLSVLRNGIITVPNEGGIVEASYKTQYYLNVQSSYGVAGGEGWYDEGATAYATLNMGSIDHGNGTRRVFTNWGGDASGTNYAQSNPITMNAPKTAIAVWKTQHYLTVISPYDTPSGMGWYDEGTTAYATLAYGIQKIAVGKRARFTGWSGDASGTALTSNPITMDKPKTAIALWTIQWYLTVKVDPFGIGTIPGEGWYDDSTSVTLQAPQYLPSINGVDGIRYKFSNWDVDGAQTGGNPITVHMNAPHTATAHYIMQYEVTFSQTGLDATATGPILTVNGETKDYNALPYKLWVNEGSTVNYDYTDVVLSIITGKRFKLESVSGPASPITISSPITVTGIYTTQYYLNVNTNPAEVLTINPSAVSGEGWYSSGSTAFVDAVQSVEKIADASKYEFRYWTNATSTGVGNQATVYMDSPKTVTANYILQHKITFDQTGVNSNYTGNIVEIDGVRYGLAELPKSFWWDEGSTHEFKFQSPLNVNAIKRFVWVSTTGLSSQQSANITITEPGKIIGNYETQWLQIFDASDNVKTDGTGLVITVNDAQVLANALPYELWADSGTTIIYRFEDEVSSSLAGKRYKLKSISGPPSGYVVSSSNLVQGNYGVQYYLAVNSPYGSPTPESGWYDAGTLITASVTSPWPTNPIDIRYICIGWTGTGSVPASGAETSVAFTINEPSSIIWHWKTQYLVSFTQTGSLVPPTVTYQIDSGPTGTEPAPFSLWIDAGFQISYNYPETISEVAGTRYLLTSISPTSPQIINAPLTVIGNYKTQHYLDVVSPYGSPSGMGWYDEGAIAHAALAYGIEEIPLNVRSIFTGWGGDTSGTNLVSNPLLMDAPKMAIANWKTQFYLTLNTSPEGVTSPIGEGWYDADTYANISTPQFVEVADGSRYRFNSWTTNDIDEITDPNTPTTSVLMDKAKTVTANYIMQYYLEIEVEPPDSAIVPGEGWYDEGALVVVIAPEYWPSTEGKRFHFDRWTIDGTLNLNNQLAVLMDKPHSATAHYTIQYSVTFNQTGLDQYAFGKVLEVNGSEKIVSDLPFTVWVNHNATITYIYAETVSSNLPGARYSLENVTGPASPLTVTQPATITGNYDATYYLEVISEYGNPYGSGWYKRGSTATFGVTTPVDHGNRTLRVFLKWSGDAEIYEPEGILIMTKPSIVTASWQTMYLVTFNTTLPNNMVLRIPNVPTTLPPGMNLFGTYYPAGEHVTVGPAPKVVMENERTRYAFEQWTLNSQPYTENENLSFIVNQPLDFAVVYDVEHLLEINAKGVEDPFKATVTIVTSTPMGYELSPTSPIQQWIRQGTRVTLTISTPNKIGHGEWAIFQKWSKDISETSRTATFTMLNSMAIDAIFFKVNPVAMSIPYSILAGLITMILCVVAARRSKPKEKKSNRRAATAGVIVMALAIIVAAIVSSSIAIGYGINPIELIDFTNWAVIFLVIEAIAFFFISALAVRKAQRTEKTEEKQV